MQKGQAMGLETSTGSGVFGLGLGHGHAYAATGILGVSIGSALLITAGAALVVLGLKKLWASNKKASEG